MKVGFIGTGRMGQAMARRLLDAGHDVAVYNRTRDKTKALADAGAKVLGSIGEACIFAAERTASASFASSSHGTPKRARSWSRRPCWAGPKW